MIWGWATFHYGGARHERCFHWDLDNAETEMERLIRFHPHIHIQITGFRP